MQKKKSENRVASRAHATMAAMIMMFTLSCWSGFNGVLDSRGQDKASPLEVTMKDSSIGLSGGTAIALKWTEPDDKSLDHVLITWTPGGAAGIKVNAGVLTYTATGMSAGTEYTITVKTVDNTGNESEGASMKITQAGSEKALKLVDTAAEVDAIRGDLNGYYILMADIDLSAYSSGAGWVPIGTGTAFSGTIDGNGHTIDNLTINTTSISYCGFVGQLASGGVIKNCSLTDVNITSNISSTGFTGSLAGYSQGTVSDCHSAGTINLTTSVNFVAYTGGLIGDNTDSAKISNCSADVDVTAESALNSCLAGGFVGQNYKSEINNCIAKGSVKGTNTGGLCYTGGFVGYNSGSSTNPAKISGCYSTGVVTGSGKSNTSTGGFVGYSSNSEITSSYSIGGVTGKATGGSGDFSSLGGFVGETYTSSIINKCYAKGNVTDSGTAGMYSYTGGFVGNNDSTSIIKICYAIGTVDSNVTSGTLYTGGFAGFNDSIIENCYATGGVEGSNGNASGFVGRYESTTTNCYCRGAINNSYSASTFSFGTGTGTPTASFYNSETDNISNSGDGTASTTEGMTTNYAATFAAWDFDTIWTIDTTKIINSGYPYLRGMVPQ